MIFSVPYTLGRTAQLDFRTLSPGLGLNLGSSYHNFGWWNRHEVESHVRRERLQLCCPPALPDSDLNSHLQVQQVQDDGQRLQKAYAGDKAEEIGRHMQAVAEAWAQLQGSSAARRQLLLDTTDKFRFFKAVRELMLWMDGINLQMDAQERPR